MLDGVAAVWVHSSGWRFAGARRLAPSLAQPLQQPPTHPQPSLREEADFTRRSTIGQDDAVHLLLALVIVRCTMSVSRKPLNKRVVALFNQAMPLTPSHIRYMLHVNFTEIPHSSLPTPYSQMSSFTPYANAKPLYLDHTRRKPSNHSMRVSLYSSSNYILSVSRPASTQKPDYPHPSCVNPPISSMQNVIS